MKIWQNCGHKFVASIFWPTLYALFVWRMELSLMLPAQYVEQSLCNGRSSVRLSVCLSHYWTQRTVGLLMSFIWAGDGWSTVVGAQQQLRRSTALSSKCRQCHMTAELMQLNTDLFMMDVSSGRANSFWFRHYIYCLLFYIVCFPTYPFFFTFSLDR